MTQSHTEKTQVVIVGAGFGGAYFAQAFERLVDPGRVEITLFDRNNYFAFEPLLVEAGTGGVEPRHAVVGIRNFLRRSQFRMAEVTRLDISAQRVYFRPGPEDEEQSIPYDHLVLAPGSVPRLVDIPGLAEHYFPLKTLSDAVALRDHAIGLLEIADQVPDSALQRELLSVVVVGSNYTGIEVAGEMEEYLRKASRVYCNVRSESWTIHIVEIKNRLLPSLDSELATYASDRLRRRGIEIHVGVTVREVRANEVFLSNGKILPTRTLVWCAGVAPPPLLAHAGLPVDEKGYLDCDRDLRVKGCQNVWGIGDAAVNRDRDGNPYPPTAQHAVQQAYHLAKNLRNVLRGEATRLCDIKSKGWLVPLGQHRAVAKVFGIEVAGFWAWFLWRTVYLFKMPGWARKVRVALDWTIEMFFRADYVQLGGFRRHRPEYIDAGEREK